MAQLYRDQFAHWINTATTTGETANPLYVREGTGVESLSVATNPQKDTFKTILDRASTTTFQNYQYSSSISGKRCYSDDPMYTYLKSLYENAIAGETQLVEIDTSSGTSSYSALQFKVIITITEWLGEGASISYDIDYEKPVKGTATIGGNSGITFTPSASL